MEGSKILTLTVVNAAALPGGAPAAFVVDRRDAVIGRAPGCDWVLPDPRSYISSKHAEIRFTSDGYLFCDLSMNGSFLNGAAERMRGSHRLRSGDTLLIGHYEVKAALSEPVAAPPPAPVAAKQSLPRAHTSWDRITDRHKVDWVRAGFSRPPGASPGIEQASEVAALAGSNERRGPADRRAPGSKSGQPAEQGAAIMLAAAGLSRADLSASGEDLLARAGQLLRLMVAGLVVMVEARARAKSEMGAETTTLRYDGNNPIKFTHTPEQALIQLLSPAQRGFMGADRAVEDAFQDLQTHQLATLDAMEGAMRATLDYFSPEAVRERAHPDTIAARMLPSARDAALWRHFEQEHSETVMDEAFTAIFIKEFRKAYEELARRR